MKQIELVGLAVFIWVLSAAETISADKPNMLLVLADDLTWHDVGCYGNQQVHTPNVDRLATQGLRFTRAFTATAMCAPSRQQLYTGLFPIRNGAYPNHSKVKSGTKSIVHYLRDLGYRVGLHGKTHFGPPESFPFEKVKNVRAFMTSKDDQPWCLVYASSSPHLPWTAGDPSRWKADELELPPYLVDTPELREAYTRYLAEIADFDREVGVLMNDLEQTRQADRTLVVVTSEQGAHMPHCKWTCYDTGLQVAFVVRWPGQVAAGNVSRAMIEYVDVVPTLVEAAGGKPPADLDGRSFLNVLKGQVESHRDHVYGVHTTRGIIAGNKCYPIRSIRDDRYKLIWNLNHEEKFQNIVTQRQDRGGYWQSWVERAESDPQAEKLVSMYRKRPQFEMYDLQADPYELNNLAELPALEDRQKQLFAKLQEWMKQQGDKGMGTECESTH